MLNTKISVVVPCYNEGRTIRENIKKIAEYLKSRFSEYEIIAVNDGSGDDTVEELEKLQVDLPALKIINNSVNEGKGKVVRDGIMASRHEITMFLDADLGIPIEELEKFIAEIQNGSDIVIASRFVPGLKIKRPVSWHRKIMEKGFRILRMVIINDWYIKDTQCGFKVFRREAAAQIFPRLQVRRFAFDAEVIFVANKLGYKIKELPISLQNPPSRTLRIIRDPLNMLMDLMKIRINDWGRKYK